MDYEDRFYAVISENDTLHSEIESLCAQLSECRKAALLEAAEWFKPKHTYEEMNVGLVQEKLRRMAEEGPK
jgi:hypothetical protein